MSHQMLFCVHCLARSDSNHLVDVVNAAAAAEVVHRTGDTLEDRTNGVSSAKTLNQFIADVSYFKVRCNQDVSFTSDF